MSMPRLRSAVIAIALISGGFLIVVIVRAFGSDLLAIALGLLAILAIWAASSVASSVKWRPVRADRLKTTWSFDPSPLGSLLEGVIDLKTAFPFRLPSDHDPNSIEEVKKTIRNLPMGNVAVDAPAAMKVSEKRTVTVTIATGTREAFLANLPAANKPLLIDETKVGASMRVELSGDPDAFAIAPVGAAIRAFAAHETWSFDITAKSRGKQKLRVHIAVLIQVPGRTQVEPYYAPVTEIEVHVRVPYFGVVKYIARAVFLALGAVAAYILALDPVKALLIQFYNRVFGAHFGLELPEHP